MKHMIQLVLAILIAACGDARPDVGGAGGGGGDAAMAPSEPPASAGACPTLSLSKCQGGHP